MVVCGGLGDGVCKVWVIRGTDFAMILWVRRSICWFFNALIYNETEHVTDVNSTSQKAILVFLDNVVPQAPPFFVPCAA